jgi:subtilisin-like proprotein convertase family protein
MASPHVAGALALLWGQNPTLSATAITNALLNNTDNVLRGGVSQYGRIDLAKAATALKGNSGAIGNSGGSNNNNNTGNPATVQRKVYSAATPRFLADATARGATTTNIPIQVADDIKIEDINVNMNIAHTWRGDLSIRLISPNGTVVNLVSRRGGSGDNLIATIDDQATSSVTTMSSALTVSGSFRGEQALSSLRGKSAKGQWTLQITDNARGDVGQITKAELDILPASSTLNARVSSKATASSVPLHSSDTARASQLGTVRFGTPGIASSEDSIQRERFRRSVDHFFASWR